MSTVVILTVVSAVLAGLVAGVFLAFSTFVMQGLARPAAPIGVAAMQGINAAAPHPLFMLPLFGGPVVGVVAAVAALAGDGDVADAWVVGGAVAGLVPAAVTVAFHVPRNLALDRVDPRSDDAPAAWARYLREWVAGNHLRTLGGVVAAVAFTVALVA
ncbi:DUF1772 domain-containing protein [Iamia sp. SCSIO 61187]|uniref:anthrone oxygenase family protein n=1 Tax=Iamia sp. SCSIO 61187 TaxID=2722752 RepID=UPI001C63B548|nr:anthrone oxygenase family protein [Iamia sp. SCSIO 61187]QYG95171.1 DUF1772 domain-containing protein [Iamia sp. SCSIO 61187]